MQMAISDLTRLQEEKLNKEMSKKYILGADFFSPISSTQLTGHP